jgi:hypothetical protein
MYMQRRQGVISLPGPYAADTAMEALESGRLLAFGDSLEPGRYALHSEFGQVVNYLRGDRLLSFVSAQVGCGPASIVMGRMELADVSRVEVGDGWVRLRWQEIPLPESKKYRSTLLFQKADPAQVDCRLQLFSRQVTETAHPASLAFLLEESRRTFFSSAFERSLAARMVEGWECLRNGHTEKGVDLIRGTGVGLTPAGDDFLAGLAAGLHLACALCQRDVGRETTAISRLSRGGSPISWSFIRFALQGRFTERVRDLLQALLSGPEREILRYGREVLAMGETSGADFSTGLLSAFRLAPAQRPARGGLPPPGV